jgi:hypothetical protein
LDLGACGPRVDDAGRLGVRRRIESIARARCKRGLTVAAQTRPEPQASKWDLRTSARGRSVNVQAVTENPIVSAVVRCHTRRAAHCSKYWARVTRPAAGST